VPVDDATARHRHGGGSCEVSTDLDKLFALRGSLTDAVR
jgi:hypothetical protein